MTDTDTAQLVVDLQATDEAVRAQGWVAPGLGKPAAPLDLLGSTLNPLTGLVTAGLGWFMPLVSFLGDGLTQLQGGNAASVSSGAQDFNGAGQDVGGVASAYRDSTSAQTANWSGAAADEYRQAGAQHADGVAGLGQASTSVGSAIIGAGQVVAQAVAEVTELVAEAVAQIVPIMSQAIARAPETFGQSVVEAIPPCVGIAIEYALRIAAKLAALLASGDNLMKLVQGGMAVVELIQQALSGISQQSVQAEASQPATAAAPQGGRPPTTMAELNPGGTAAAGQSGGGSSAPMSSGGGYGGAPSIPSVPGGAVNPQGTHSWTPPATSPSGVVPPPVTDALRSSGGAGAVPSGALPIGAAAGAASRGPAAAGARVGAGPVRQETDRPSAGTSGGGDGSPRGGAVPFGAMGAGHPAGDGDKEHKRKYGLPEQHDEPIDGPPAVITESKE